MRRRKHRPLHRPRGSQQVVGRPFDAVALQKYHWVERIDHVHTPGNSSGIVDGASLLAIGNAKTGEALGLTPRARILATAVSGAYANFLSSATDEDVAAVYPTETYERLAAVKQQYDPTNLFAGNHNVPPR